MIFKFKIGPFEIQYCKEKQDENIKDYDYFSEEYDKYINCIFKKEEEKEAYPYSTETIDADESMIEMLNNIGENVAYLDKKINSLEKKINKLLNNTLNKTPV